MAEFLSEDDLELLRDVHGLSGGDGASAAMIAAKYDGTPAADRPGYLADLDARLVDLDHREWIEVTATEAAVVREQAGDERPFVASFKLTDRARDELGLA